MRRNTHYYDTRGAAAELREEIERKWELQRLFMALRSADDDERREILARIEELRRDCDHSCQ